MKTMSLLASLLMFTTVALARPSKTSLVAIPRQPTLLVRDDSGTSRIAVRFDISGVDQESGVVQDGVEPEANGKVEVQAALLEWEVPGIPADRTTDYAVYGVTSAWQTGADGRVSVEIAPDPLDTWEITPFDHSEGTGNLIRLNVLDWVRGWAAGSVPNQGLVLATGDLSENALSEQILSARLMIRYGRVAE
jgi:hypothetical protein